MDRYDPERGPDPGSWLNIDEDERLLSVQASIRKSERLPDPKLHATIHLIVENQIAMTTQTPVAGVLERLCGDGLLRHEAVHAIGSILSKYIYRALKLGDASEALPDDPNEAYWQELEMLSADSWRRSR